MKVFKKLLVGFSFLMLIGNVSLGAEKKALLVGVGNYGEDSDWCNTKATNDVLLMSRTLEKNGFHYSQSITNSQATKSAIISTLERFVEILDTGDVFLFYFSGHGQLVVDQNADEQDRYDESLVLYGAPKLYDAAYNMENHLLDEELSALLNRIQNKLGSEGEVIVLIDAGFGEMQQVSSNNVSRGGSEPYGKNNSQTKEIIRKKNGVIDDLPFNEPNSNTASLVEMIATSQTSGAVDYQENGLFTFAVAQSFDKITDSTSYNDFFESVNQICKTLGENQEPYAYGSLDRNLFKHVKSLSYLDSSENATRGNSAMSETEVLLIEDLIKRTVEEGEIDKMKADSIKGEFRI